MSARIKYRITALLMIPLVLIVESSGQRVSPDVTENLSSTPVENIQIESQGIEAALTRISLANNIPMALEIAQDDGALRMHNLEFAGGSLQNLLDELVRKNDKYVWKIEFRKNIQRNRQVAAERLV